MGIILLPPNEFSPLFNRNRMTTAEAATVIRIMMIESDSECSASMIEKFVGAYPEWISLANGLWEAGYGNKRRFG